ncbi:MAG: CmcJ/NvfI family oxidoreductase [Pseudonocardia sp.]
MDLTSLPTVADRVGYLPASARHPRYTIYPPSAGRPSERPPIEYHAAVFHDCRPVLDELLLDRDGLAFRRTAAATDDLFDDEFVRGRYYAETETVVREVTGARAVVAFDHNVRSADRARREEAGAQPPVDAAHGDYSEGSGHRRVREVFVDRGVRITDATRTAIVNVWRPICAVVQDRPLAVCDPRTVSPDDLVETAIDHFGEDVARPRHSGQIYSLRFSAAHRWLYLADMRSTELMLFTAFDSATDGRPRFVAHAAFTNPTCPSGFTPRESIEVRTAVVF